MGAGASAASMPLPERRELYAVSAQRGSVCLVGRHGKGCVLSVYDVGERGGLDGGTVQQQYGMVSEGHKRPSVGCFNFLLVAAVLGRALQHVEYNVPA